MPYATQADLTSRFGAQQLLRLADRDGDDVVDAAVVAAALEGASATIDSYVGGVYQLPLASTPPALMDACIDIAFYRLHPAGTPDDVRKRFDDAIKWLQQIARGLVKLDLAGVEPDGKSGQVEIEGPERVFSRDSLAGW